MSALSTRKHRCRHQIRSLLPAPWALLICGRISRHNSGVTRVMDSGQRHTQLWSEISVSIGRPGPSPGPATSELSSAGWEVYGPVSVFPLSDRRHRTPPLLPPAANHPLAEMSAQPSPAQPRLSFYMSTVRDLHLRAEYPDVAAPHCSLLCSLSSLDLESEKLRQLTEVQVAAGCQTGDENNLNLNI